MSYGFYKVLHLVGVIGTFFALGALTLHIMGGGARKFAQRKWVMITHGVSLFFVFLAGFGLMARIGIVGGGWPTWIWGKLAIWIILGMAASFIPRWPQAARGLWITLILLGGLAAYLANFKP